MLHFLTLFWYQYPINQIDTMKTLSAFQGGNHLLDLSYELKRGCPIPSNRKHLIACLLAFSSDVCTDLSEPDLVFCKQKEIESSLHLHHFPTLSRMNQKLVLKILPTMTEVFDITFAWNWNLRRASLGGGEMVMSFTQEENSALLSQIQTFAKVYLDKFCFFPPFNIPFVPGLQRDTLWFPGTSVYRVLLWCFPSTNIPY